MPKLVLPSGTSQHAASSKNSRKPSRWDDGKWEEHFNELKLYKLERNTFVISTKDDLHKHLREWVKTQRRLERNGRLLTHRRSKLLELGFDFSPSKLPEKGSKFTLRQIFNWHCQYTKLIEYKLLNGHCNVSYNDKTDPELAKWVSLQRKTKEAGSMDEMREKLLDSIGFCWKLFSQQERVNSK